MPPERLLCLFNRHRPLRDKIEWNGMTYIGTCKYCGAEIQRLDKGGWRRRKVTNV